MKMAWRLIKMARQHWGVLSVAALALIGAAVMGLVTPGIVQKLHGFAGEQRGHRRRTGFAVPDSGGCIRTAHGVPLWRDVFEPPGRVELCGGSYLSNL